ncbi:MAG: enoyl-CoA hydratase-related protein [Sphingomonadaceae bacterium]
MIDLQRHANGVAVLTINRPQALNALDFPLVDALREALASLEADKAVRVLILTGQGKAFCAGLDLKEVILGDEAPEGPIEFMDLQERYAGLMKAVHGARFPVIAAVNGVAVGAGMGLALAADIRIAGPGAKFLVGAVKVALSAGECGISYHLPRLVGAGRAFELMLTGRAVDAAEALSIGLATSLAGEGDLLDAALSVAGQIVENSPYAVKHTKQVMHANLDAPGLDAAMELENHVQCLALVTEDFREACRAFAEKRKPQFTGR